VRDFDADKHLYTVKREAKRVVFPNLEYERPKKESMKEEPLKASKSEEPAFAPEPAGVAEAQPKKVIKSFFDEIN